MAFRQFYSLIATGNFLLLECVFGWEHVQRDAFLFSES